MATTTRTAAQQQIFDAGVADALAGRPATPPEGEKLAKAYTDGFESVPRPEPKKAPAKKAPATKKAPAKKAPAKKAPARRAPAAVRRPATKAARQIYRPVESQVVSGMALIASAALVAFLYNLIRNAETTATAIDKLVAAVRWLDSTDPIPYRTS